MKEIRMDWETYQSELNSEKHKEFLKGLNQGFDIIYDALDSWLKNCENYEEFCSKYFEPDDNEIKVDKIKNVMKRISSKMKKQKKPGIRVPGSNA
jgi:hypothetical protein